MLFIDTSTDHACFDAELEPGLGAGDDCGCPDHASTPEGGAGTPGLRPTVRDLRIGLAGMGLGADSRRHHYGLDSRCARQD